MVSIDYVKLDEVSVALKKLYEMVQYNLEGLKLGYNVICITPLEALMCPQIGNFEDDMDKLQAQGNEALEDIQELITGIHNVIYKFQESESKIARDINAATVSSSLLGADALSSSALMLLGRGSSIQGTEKSNSDNYSEDCLSLWDVAVGEKVTSGLVAALDRTNTIGIEKIYNTGSKISPNQLDNGLMKAGFNRTYRRPFLRNMPKGVRDMEMPIPKKVWVGKNLGVLTVGLTALSVVDDFDNNKTVPQKFEASGVDVGMTGLAYLASSFAVGLIDTAAVAAVTAGAIASTPVVAIAVVSVGVVVGIGVGANYATSVIKNAWNLR